MSKPISAYPTTRTGANTPKDLTASDVPGDKYALDVNVASGSITISSITAATPTVYEINAAVAGTEYSQALSANVKRFFVKVRNQASGATVRLAFISGDTTTGPYFSFSSNSSYEEEGLNATGLTIYVQTDLAGQVIEVVEWV